ncbi:hypothetical protein EVG20_g852 [Dentipellis fragilis]|uniref:Uncharacterized protein n=1 Tax=Dentipellis fragilis TaxID=205917 RepID=A0A4Y9ZDV9_9AGAM|nr:hypothetical protein EVG20_g852 [Dentipellis fragilis]
MSADRQLEFELASHHTIAFQIFTLPCSPAIASESPMSESLIRHDRREIIFESDSGIAYSYTTTRAAHNMAYPNSPGGLPRTLYTGMSSMQIASPRAGHTTVPAHHQTPYIPNAVGSPCLHPDLYSGMSSMRIASPYPHYVALPTHPQTPPINNRSLYSSQHTYESCRGSKGMPSPAAQSQDHGIVIKGLKEEDIDRSSSGQGHLPKAAPRSNARYTAPARQYEQINTEDICLHGMQDLREEISNSERRELLASQEKMLKEMIDREKILVKELSEKPNDPWRLKSLEEHRRQRHVTEDMMQLHRTLIRSAEDRLHTRLT